MKGQQRKVNSFLVSLMAAGVVCLSPLISFADTTTQAATPLYNYPQNADVSQPLTLLPLQSEPSPANFTFDMGGTESRNLQLQLSNPITLNINNNQMRSSSGVGSVFLDSSLSLQLSDNLDITSSLGAGRTESAFQPLGSIHCQNGVLDQGCKL